MKKFMSLLMVAALVSNTAFASPSFNTNNTAKIAKAFDSFRYQMTVVANPNDPSFQKQATADFKKRMINLQAEGVSAEEIMDYTRNSMLDSATRADFDRMMAAMDVEKMSSEEAGNISMQFMANKYQQGANYSGGGRASIKAAAIILGVIIVGVVTYLLIKHKKDCTKTVTQTNIQTQTVTNVTTNTQTVTSVETINNTDTVTNTETLVTTETVTNTNTITDYNTVTITVTDTNTDTGTNYGYCCNGVTGNVVPASPTGCLNGDALYWVATAEACISNGPSSGWDD